VKTDELIANLAARATPVKRVAPPALAAAGWLAMAVLVLGIPVGLGGLRHDIEERLMLPHEQLNLVAALATGITAALAAFHLALPDRSPRWALLPLPFAIFWVSGLGMGCIADFLEQGFPALTTSFECMGWVVGFGIPLSTGMLWMTRHAAPIRPEPVAALAGLAAASIASVGLTLVHHLDAAAMVLIWHGLSVVLMTRAGRSLGSRAMRAIGP
jgi:hypothetical protein